MKKTLLLILLMILTSSLALAEEFTLMKNEEIDYKGLSVKLLNIGTRGSALIKVNDLSRSIEKNKQEIINDLKITLIESSEETVKIDIEPAVECLINNDCDDNKACTEDICTSIRKCTHRNTQGCPKDGACLPEGTYEYLDGKLSYCSSGFEWKARKDEGISCINNYECLSALCEQDKCTKPLNTEEEEQDEMAPTWFVNLIGIILLIIGILFILTTKKTKNFMREFSYIRENYLKIIGIILLALGIAVFLWALA